MPGRKWLDRMPPRGHELMALGAALATLMSRSQRMTPALPPVIKQVGSYCNHGAFWRRHWSRELDRQWALSLPGPAFVGTLRGPWEDHAAKGAG